ncbi:chromosome partitioning protein ParB [Sphingobium sp. TomMM35A]
MTRPRRSIAQAFEDATLRINLAAILPLREVSDQVKKSVKYAQIAASVSEVGIIEPPVVIRDPLNPNQYHLLDGHLRVQILLERGDSEVVCLVATEDEAFTYNKRINRIAIIQEHRMILNAIQKGVSEERLARALNVNIANIRSKRNLLRGICPEAVALLNDKHLPLAAFVELRKLKPLRQIEAAELMIAMNRFSTGYAKSLVAATPEDQLVTGRRKILKGLTSEQIALMERESASLDREFKMVEQTYGADHLDLVLAIGYVNRLLSNARIVRYLAHHHADILGEFQKIVDVPQAA